MAPRCDDPSTEAAKGAVATARGGARGGHGPPHANNAPAVPTPALEARDITCSYDHAPVLRDISLEVRRGEIVGLLGPNGAGKSTLVKALSGVLTPQSGEAFVDGEALSALSRQEAAQRIAVVPQEPHFGFPFSVLEVVLMGRHPHRQGLAFDSEQDHAIARDALDCCHALHLAERCIDALSSGERQRIVFARALAQQPRLLLLDEPTSFLDVRHQVELYDLVRDRADSGATAVLAVMHDLNLAAEFCDRVYLLKHGRISAGGPTDEVFTYSTLTSVFDTDIYVDTNDLTGKLIVVPMSRRRRPAGNTP